ncbi:MAG: hypothetical protein AB1297_02020 [bacterium]
MKSQKSKVKSQKCGKNLLNILSLVICCLVIVSGCKKKEEVKEEKPKPPIPVEVPPPKYETYQYLDLGRRDPFVPLKGPGVAKMPKEVEVVIGTKREEGGMEGWAISGYIFDKKEKIAVIKAQEENYLFADNKLLDKDGNDLPEIKVKTKEDGIILTKKGKELFLKMEEKEIREEIQ